MIFSSWVMKLTGFLQNNSLSSDLLLHFSYMSVYVCFMPLLVHLNASKIARDSVSSISLLISWIYFSQHCYS